MRWAVDEVMAYSPAGSVVAADLPVPHWSWDGLVDGPPAIHDPPNG
jgi:hemoglobin